MVIGTWPVVRLTAVMLIPINLTCGRGGGGRGGGLQGTCGAGCVIAVKILLVYLRLPVVGWRWL